MYYQTRSLGWIVGMVILTIAGTDAIAYISNVRLNRMTRGIQVQWFGYTNSSNPADHYQRAGGLDDVKVDIDKLKANGYRHLRVTGDAARVFCENGDLTRLNMVHVNFLKQVCEYAASTDVALIIDVLHNMPKTPNYIPDNLTQWQTFYEQFAKELSVTDPEYIFIEIMNEPCCNWTKWNDAQRKIFPFIRKSAPNHTIILTADLQDQQDQWDHMNAVMQLTRVVDPNVAYTFHFYESGKFTGGTGLTPSGTYPGWGVDFQYLRDRMKRIYDWSIQHQVSVHCGEWGAAAWGGTTAADQYAYFRDLRTIMDGFSIAWTLWFGPKSHNMAALDLSSSLTIGHSVTPPQQPKADTTVMKINKAVSGIRIDAVEEGGWSSASVHSLSNTVLGSSPSVSDLSASVKAMWSDSALLVFASVKDNRPFRDPSLQAYLNDGVEVFIDRNGQRGVSFDADDFQFIFNWGDTTAVELRQSKTSGVRHSYAPQSGGYTMEIDIPWKTLGALAPKAGDSLGIEVMAIDNDSSGRKCKLAWHSYVDSAWTSPRYFGKSVLAYPPSTGARVHHARARAGGAAIGYAGSGAVVWFPRTDDYEVSLHTLSGAKVHSFRLRQCSQLVLPNHTLSGMNILVVKSASETFTRRILPEQVR